MRRCFDLARLGGSKTSPNPRVGALIWHEGHILGEGYHKQYGRAHAEVEAFAAVRPGDLSKIPQSTLFVSLEPCCIHHNTPACTDLILRERFRRVVVSVRDPNPGVNGRGLDILRKAGIEVREGILADEGKELIQEQLLYYREKRPYITLKYAQTSTGYLGLRARQLQISGALSQRLVHRWRSESDAILIGSGTALTDNPRLTNRLWFGESPLRILLDRRKRLINMPSLTLLSDGAPVWMVGTVVQDSKDFRQMELLPYPAGGLPELMQVLAEKGIRRLLVEGGRKVLDSFLQSGLWDEIRRSTSKVNIPATIQPNDRVAAPRLPAEAQLVKTFMLGNDHWEIFKPLR